MAERVTRQKQIGIPTVTAFCLNEEELKRNDIKVKYFEEYTVEWLEFVVANRNNHSETPIHPYDIVIGPIANDTIGVFLSLYRWLCIGRGNNKPSPL